MALDPRIKAVGFDMDGTVMDTVVDYVRLARIVSDEYRSLDVPAEIIERDMEGSTVENGVAWLEEHKPECLDGLQDRLNDRATVIECEHSDLAKPFPGAAEIVKEIRSRGYRVGILTRGGREYAI
ncbi:MAG: HAD hydrolase-like protein [Candidatus Methanomethylophilus sp.]|nr:HAD hydrolase-like protein [Methanomethylophilus sp.]